jgi:hypothetical protein
LYTEEGKKKKKKPLAGYIMSKTLIRKTK